MSMTSITNLIIINEPLQKFSRPNETIAPRIGPYFAVGTSPSPAEERSVLRHAKVRIYGSAKAFDSHTVVGLRSAP